MSDGNVDVHTGPALARMPCATCEVETLHRGAQCVHCGQWRSLFATKTGKKRDWTVSPKARPPRMG
jgi:hypothetical protein